MLDRRQPTQHQARAGVFDQPTWPFDSPEREEEANRSNRLYRTNRWSLAASTDKSRIGVQVLYVEGSGRGFGLG
jgi:hypothetical protein